MKSLHLSTSLSRAAGGIFEIELALAKHLQMLGVGVEAFGLSDEHWPADAPRWEPVPARVFDTKGPRAYGFAPGLFEEMIGSGADCAHLHYMWMYPSVAMTKWAEKTGRPYVVTPNGMLEPWALSNSAWKKKVAGFLYENRMLRGAACLQANTEKELRDIRAYGLKNPVAIIPNGVELVSAERLQTEKLKPEKKKLLFLGRIHPKKGLINALKAWKQVLHSTSNIQNSKSHEWQFVVAGWDQGGHEAELKELATELGIRWADVRDSEEESSAFSFDPAPRRSPEGTSRSVLSMSLRSIQFSEFQLLFVGPAFGEQKEMLLRSASAFILPSFSEGLPMSVLEAWSYGLPVLMTDHCNIPEGFAADAALRIDTDVESIATGLSEFFQASASDLQALGDNGRALVERQFTWDQVAVQMKEVYEWVLGGGERPDCVRQF
ncbi:glycosyltransferase [Akkermansiaceae bacterium]|nr:glycosyltransferase [Akkermansiaceae bacterium]MDC1205951.1 glycosyltransferase [Akkermansiaceae bacterium]